MNGSYTFTATLKLTDGGTTSVSDSFTIDANNPPVANDITVSTDKNTAIAINVLSEASDPDGDTVTLTGVSNVGTLGSVSINADGTVHYSPNGQFNDLTQGQTATDSFGYTVSDGFSTSSATVTVVITGVNDPPVLADIETTPVAYEAQTAPVQITSTLTISDDDDTTISGATVSIAAGFDVGADDGLGFTNQNGITGSYDASTGVLTLSGNASVADYQAALRSVQFGTGDTSASPGARTISFTVTDSVGATSNSAQRTVDVSEFT